ncbi:WXG100 family type VII secretion target [Saccharopolyspora sp. K220]|uniref:WXG100 family type VII secretion target n=1 Tax=Saccharopolyspora soli TaxID=2926618 RepID=UPI001F598B11|nr:WXG100 family type VII secretion target [Saccharopolyspora soli]MCI2423460.1 WXG100 family type VII secretion target [Saccharopolyspora soli]
MPLDIKVDPQPGTIRTAADWLDGMARAVDAALDTINRVRGESESGWSSEAGKAFRDGMGKIGPRVDEVSISYSELAFELRRHADAIDTVKVRMDQARELALTEGLVVQGDLIMEPGPEPPAPRPLPTDKPASPEQKQIHADAVRAEAAFVRTVQAYTDCAALVSEARRLENDSIAILNRFLGGLIEKAPFNASDVLAGLAGATAGQTAKMQAKAMQIARSGSIEVSERLANNPYMTLQGRTRAAAINITRSQAAAELERKAIGSRTAQWVDKLGPRTKGFLQLTLDFGKKPETAGSGLLRGALKVGGRLPVVGLLITGGGIGYDIGIAGKDPTTSVASGLGGFVAGAGASVGLAAMGTPVGWVVAGGAVVSWGVGFAIEEWGDDTVQGMEETGKRLSEINPKMTR